MYLGGRARTWKQSYFISRHAVTWDEFTESLCRRFSQVGERYLVREFTNLRQYGTVEKYQEKFEELRTQLLSYNPSLTEEHLIACYINGLKEDLVPFMDIAYPVILEEAYEQAKLHERALAVMNRKTKRSYRVTTFPQPNHNTKPSGGNSISQSQQKGVTNTAGNNKQLIEQRRAAGLCFKCGDKYHYGHICANRNVSSLQGMEGISEIYDEDSLREELGGEEDQELEEEGILEMHEVGVSVWALSGEKQQDTIKVQGEVEGKTITILVNTGSTHSFLDLYTAKGIKAQMIAAPPRAVTVANGQKVLSKLQCPDF